MSRRIAVLLVALSLLPGATGVFALWLLHKPAVDHISEVVPAEAIAYAHVFLRPSSQERLDIEHLLEQVLGSDDAADDVKDALEAVVEPLLEPQGLSYEDDVRPFVGSEAAWFMLPSVADQALVIEAKGDRAAESLVPTALAVVDRRGDLHVRAFGTFTAIGTGPALLALEETAGGGRSLAASGAPDILASLSVERVAGFFFRPAATGAGDSAGATLSVREDGIQVDATAAGAPDATAVTEALADAPPPANLIASALASLPDLLGGRALNALRLTGAVGDGTDRDTALLGDGFEAHATVDVARLVALAGTFGLLDSRATPARGVTEHLSRMVLGTQRMDGTTTIRIFIGVK